MDLIYLRGGPLDQIVTSSYVNLDDGVSVRLSHAPEFGDPAKVKLVTYRRAEVQPPNTEPQAYDYVAEGAN